MSIIYRQSQLFSKDWINHINMPNHLKFSTIFLLFISSFAFAQQRQMKDTIDTDVVNVVKPYTPSISDAFKIKETPVINDSITGVKKNVKYNIFSIPVASTFTPAKGKAANVTKDAPQRIYDNYASVGFGSYTTLLGELYLNHDLDNSNSVGAYLSHHSSQGGIEGVVLEDSFSETNLNLNYSAQARNFNWNLDGGFEYDTYNWYGVPDQTVFSEDFDVMHSFYSGYFGGEIDFMESFLKKANVKFRRFGDDSKSGENRLTAGTEFNIPINDEVIITKLGLDYINGNFDRSYFLNEEFKYGNVNFSIAPQYQLRQDDLTINLGINFVYLKDTEANDNDIFIYPNITASYRLLEDAVIAFGGIEGGLIQNSYYDFANENPFVSPTLYITPTDQKYNATLGIKGKLSNSMSYSFSGNYRAENAKGLYKSNPIQDFTGQENYTYGNSFGIAYDNVKTFSAAGELNLDVNRNFKLGIKGEFLGYSTDVEEEAWNLPDVKASLFLDYQISEKFFAGLGLYYIGERKDQISYEGSLVNEPLTTTVTLDSYFDANAHVGYKILDYLSIYGKVNNIGDQDYNRWVNYPVQGIQFMAGATYQFDF
ncbi:TonB dependent receptor [Flavobacteriaceae bacterium MAR_2010_188]|nr:TonB dependent receptor [Flavobacteriaceae bacterium MAR_2010_188]